MISKNVIPYLDDVFVQSQSKKELFEILEKYHQNLLKQIKKAASDKSRIDAIKKLQPLLVKRKSKKKMEC